ncbi:MAG: M14 family zinc carboxypeptidase [Cyclobacteriaceae bacterium]
MKLKLLNFCFAIMLAVPGMGQLNEQLYNAYDKYDEQSITTRRFKHDDIMAVIEKLGKEFKVNQVGTSVEGRAIKLITYGSGPVDVLMWSQMHGDETTATRSIMDVFHWLEADDEFNEVRNKIKSSITWHFIPMLNPDGASRFTRRNHYGIDINRDAIHLQTPEGRTLKRVRDSLNADWGYNLHDQGRGTSVEGLRPATISLLAPAYDVKKSINEKRGDAMQLTKLMHDQIIKYIPGQIGIYDDTFEPRAFGDNIQKWGTRTILIESGGYQDDWEKQYIRKLNFVMLITAAHSIATKSYEKTPAADYQKIPRNGQSRLRELIVANVQYEGLMRDVAFDRTERDSEDYRNYCARGYITDLGDLQTSHSFFTLDAKGYEVLPGKIYEKVFRDIKELEAIDAAQLFRQGYTDFIVTEGFDPFTSNVPFNIHEEEAPPNDKIQMGANPSLLFRKDGKIKYIVVNGQLHKIE